MVVDRERERERDGDAPTLRTPLSRLSLFIPALLGSEAWPAAPVQQLHYVEIEEDEVAASRAR